VRIRLRSDAQNLCYRLPTFLHEVARVSSRSLTEPAVIAVNNGPEKSCGTPTRRVTGG
jgi:hypothetical protein